MVLKKEERMEERGSFEVRANLNIFLIEIKST
jgi:hypothetical protein